MRCALNAYSKVSRVVSYDRLWCIYYVQLVYVSFFPHIYVLIDLLNIRLKFTVRRRLARMNRGLLRSNRKGAYRKSGDGRGMSRSGAYGLVAFVVQNNLPYRTCSSLVDTHESGGNSCRTATNQSRQAFQCPNNSIRHTKFTIRMNFEATLMNCGRWAGVGRAGAGRGLSHYADYVLRSEASTTYVENPSIYMSAF